MLSQWFSTALAGVFSAVCVSCAWFAWRCSVAVYGSTIPSKRLAQLESEVIELRDLYERMLAREKRRGARKVEETEPTIDPSLSSRARKDLILARLGLANKSDIAKLHRRA